METTVPAPLEKTAETLGGGTFSGQAADVWDAFKLKSDCPTADAIDRCHATGPFHQGHGQVYGSVASSSQSLSKAFEIQVEATAASTPSTSCGLSCDTPVLSMAPLDRPLAAWSVDDVRSWAASLAPQLPEEIAWILADNAINGQVLVTLTESEIGSMGITKFGWRRQLVLSVQELVRFQQQEHEKCSDRATSQDDGEALRVISNSASAASSLAPMDSPPRSSPTGSPPAPPPGPPSKASPAPSMSLLSSSGTASPAHFTSSLALAMPEASHLGPSRGNTVWPMDKPSQPRCEPSPPVVRHFSDCTESATAINADDCSGSSRSVLSNCSGFAKGSAKSAAVAALCISSPAPGLLRPDSQPSQRMSSFCSSQRPRVAPPSRAPVSEIGLADQDLGTAQPPVRMPTTALQGAGVPRRALSPSRHSASMPQLPLEVASLQVSSPSQHGTSSPQWSGEGALRQILSPSRHGASSPQMPLLHRSSPTSLKPLYCQLPRTETPLMQPAKHTPTRSQCRRLSPRHC